jgi:IS5 family transposase
MLKALILQAWHNLSDRGLEEALKVRIEVVLFVWTVMQQCKG